jgi:hypothetical protein
MRLILSCTLLSVALLSLAGFSSTEATITAQKEVKLLSAYECSGLSPNGSGEKYVLSLSVKQNGDHYDLEWSGKDNQIALGILTGNVLSVSILSLKKGKNGEIEVFAGGVGAYVVEGGMLSGKWTVGHGKVYTETCVPPKSLAA